MISNYLEFNLKASESGWVSFLWLTSLGFQPRGGLHDNGVLSTIVALIALISPSQLTIFLPHLPQK